MKFKAFFKKLGASLYDWFIASNRWLHLMAGWVIFLLTAIVIGLPMGAVVNPASMILGAYVATLFAMIGLEVKDKAKGGKFDWKDLNAGMFLGNVLLIAYLIFLIIDKL